MGVDLEPWFVPMKSVCNASEEARVLVLHDSYFSYKVNSLGAGWIAPIPLTLIIFSCTMEWMNHCVPFLFSWEMMVWSSNHRMVYCSLILDAISTKRRRCGDDKPSSCYFTQYPNSPFMTTIEFLIGSLFPLVVFQSWRMLRIVWSCDTSQTYL
jgi:hypothetical protein